jgi:ketosteroid isomerase-like protein
MSTDENKSLMLAGFEAWAKGEGDFYSLLADDAKWTITGSSPVAGTLYQPPGVSRPGRAANLSTPVSTTSTHSQDHCCRR